jgi:YD repeat-containing protein
MTFAPHDVLPRSLRPSALRRRAGLLLHRGTTLAEFADGLAELHGDARLVTESLPSGRDRTLTYAQAARLVAQWSAASAWTATPVKSAAGSFASIQPRKRTGFVT